MILQLFSQIFVFQLDFIDSASTLDVYESINVNALLIFSNKGKFNN